MTEGRARRSLRLKVEALEQALRTGAVTSEIPLITKIEDIQRWHSPPMISWKSFSVAAPGGSNPDLRKRLDNVLSSFIRLQSGKKKRGPQPPRGMSVSDWLVREERDALLRQNAQLIARVQELEMDRLANQAAISSQTAKIAELSAALRKVAPLRASK